MGSGAARAAHPAVQPCLVNVILVPMAEELLDRLQVALPGCPEKRKTPASRNRDEQESLAASGNLANSTAILERYFSILNCTRGFASVQCARKSLTDGSRK